MPDLYQIAKSIAERPIFIKRNVVVNRSLSFSYLIYRVLRPVLKFYTRLLNSVYGKNKPWLSPAAIRILKNCLNPQMTGLEYGSGRSTQFIAMRVKKLISIEHDPQWYQQVSEELRNSNVRNVTYIKILADQEETKIEIENRYKKEYQAENEIYFNYYEKVTEYPDSYFDFIIIDGRARVECSKRAISKLKNGGMFVLDNSERKRYKPIHRMLSEWKMIKTTTGLTDTTFWFKSSENG